MREPVARLRVEGDPRPQGSKNVYRGPDGKARLVESAGESLALWRTLVAMAARSERARARRPLLDGPLWCSATFYLDGPRRAVRPFPSVPPDLDKLLRGIADALTDSWWVDDAQVVEWSARKVYASPGEPPGVELAVGVIAGPLQDR